jgi:hypothetical protein
MDQYLRIDDASNVRGLRLSNSASLGGSQQHQGVPDLSCGR